MSSCSQRSLLAFSMFGPTFITLIVRLVLSSQMRDRHCQGNTRWSDLPLSMLEVCSPGIAVGKGFITSCLDYGTAAP